ncbi:MAG: hypothetical protein ABI334_01185 [Candidatus Dormiibacterota bacterium]
MSMQLSPDGMYYWDGQQWQSTLSHDGRTRWNGSAWIPVQSQGYAFGASPRAPVTREPTSWTRPLQYAVAGWYVLSAIYALSLPFWMSGPMSQAINQSIQHQEKLNPTASPPPADLTAMVTSFMTVGIVVGGLIGLALCAVAVIGALKRWTWIYYVVLVLLGLGTISLPVNLVSAVTGSSVAAASGFSMPVWITWIGILFSIPAAALFVWMLVALVQRGPWGMKKLAPAVS